MFVVANRRGREKHFDFPEVGISERVLKREYKAKSYVNVTSIFTQCYNIALHRWTDNIENNNERPNVGTMITLISSMIRHLKYFQFDRLYQANSHIKRTKK